MMKRSLITLTNPRSPVSEAYRTLRTNLQFSGIDRQLKRLMVTSTGPGEGKSTTIANLAIVTAQTEKKTVLIDADLRKPTVHHTFEIPNRHGLTTVITGQASAQEVVQSTTIPHLDVITAGPIPPNPAELIGSQAMTRFIEEVATLYDQVLFDTPPVLAVTDAQILASKLDGVIMVVNAGKTNKEMALRAKVQLENVQANIVGVVLNNKKMQGNSGYYYYYGQN
ncbi:capsular biosynthesis protein [Ammoniphilus oxalaticus]|uniref:non-specific protein-tyrosine kinase n=1 Tax=Ammoniphilus oxalaticus TaxID=66863 RepID=A0A419SHH5_9BACL|nr:CpsD/CapB family tyrosine-protein kinase [Ammoniphilus oxalaticus]RKD23238.1 capsular biosynthesis protein [Ammoniphilus oxalaticus]